MRSRLGSALLLVGLLGAVAALGVAAFTYAIDVDSPSDEERAVSECEALISQTVSHAGGPSFQDPAVSRNGPRWTVDGPLEEPPHDRWRCFVVHDPDGGGWDAVRARNLGPEEAAHPREA